MNWEYLTELSQLDKLAEESTKQPVLIFKHSTSCAISRASLDRLERNWSMEKGAKLYFLDLLKFRPISNEIASRFDIPHESPQVLIIENGQLVYDASHFDINYKDIKAKLEVVAD